MGFVSLVKLPMPLCEGLFTLRVSKTLNNGWVGLVRNLVYVVIDTRWE